MKLSINNPCTQKFEKFQATAEGGFCKGCQTNVVDFTKMSQDEIIAYLSNRKGEKVCGRLRKEQLSAPSPSRPQARWGSGLFLALTVFSVAPLFPALAQEDPVEMTENTDPENLQSSSEKTEKLIKGVVRDEKDPIPFANVVITRDGKFIAGTSTNMEGEFSIKVELQKGDQISVNFIGYEELIVIADGIQDEFHFLIKESDQMLLGEVQFEEKLGPKPNLWARITNLFS